MEVEQFLSSLFCKVCAHAILQKWDRAVIGALLFDFGGQSIPLLSVQISGGGCLAW